MRRGRKTRVVGVKVKRRGRTTVITKMVKKVKRKKRGAKTMNLLGVKIVKD